MGSGDVHIGSKGDECFIINSLNRSVHVFVSCLKAHLAKL